MIGWISDLPTDRRLRAHDGHLTARTVAFKADVSRLRSDCWSGGFLLGALYARANRVLDTHPTPGFAGGRPLVSGRLIANVGIVYLLSAKRT
jgi:hypothetical protein